MFRHKWHKNDCVYSVDGEIDEDLTFLTFVNHMRIQQASTIGSN